MTEHETPSGGRLVLNLMHFARALRAAVEDDPRVGGVPSTKGTL